MRTRSINMEQTISLLLIDLRSCIDKLTNIDKSTSDGGAARGQFASMCASWNNVERVLVKHLSCRRVGSVIGRAIRVSEEITSVDSA